ncbi:chemotaxis protein CheA [Algiphilus sp.]|uniref:chemotaxis protein CheA n=1 Tax=Algiphilus sp. TaxID=1872431 RepID=UPI003B52DEE9
MSMEEIFATFIAESRDQIEEMERSLFALEQAPDDAELLNTVFRAAHTIKGSAGLFALETVIEFTHTAENLLDALRHGQLHVDAELISELLRVVDVLRVLIDCASRHEDPPSPHTEKDDLIAAMARRLAAIGKSAPGAASKAATANGDDAGQQGRWLLSIRFDPDIAKSGNNPLGLLRYLRELGTVMHVVPVETQALDADAFDASRLYLGFEIAMLSDATKQELEAVFEWVADDSNIAVLGPQPTTEALAKRLLELPGDPAEVIAAWEQCAVIDAKAAAILRGAPKDDTPAVEAHPKETQATSQEVASKAKAAKASRSDGETRFIRIDSRRLDHLINLVGELVIAGSGARMLADETGNEALIEANEQFQQLVEDVRDSSLSLRTVPLETIFSRFTRVVREISHDLGKNITIDFEGGETEIDRSLIERISDPLIHLVRNAADHGIEPPVDREAAGKDPMGRIKMKAYYDSGSVVIEISDDGRGVNPEKIRKKALSLGLIDEDQAVPDEQLQDMLFEPGFSTASAVTNISGRGVGLDVVRKNLKQVRGTVGLNSAVGKGSTFTLRLPLTLAIIDGFLVTVGTEKYVIPVELIRECIEVPTLQSDSGGFGICNVRGAVLPFVRLSRWFNRPDSDNKRPNMVVAQVGDRYVGLVVDRLLGESQTVIKPLGRLFAGVPGIGGATILGTGEVALILDVPAMVRSIDADTRASLEQAAA